MAYPVSKVHKFFPVLVREYIKPEDKLNDDLINFFKDYPQRQTNFPEGVITSRPDLQKCDNIHVRFLIEWFNECLEEYRNQYQLYCEGLTISQMWFNHAPAKSGAGHPLHRHPMAYVSAVYYLTEGAKTAFDDPVTPRVYDTLELNQHDKMEAEWGILSLIHI